MELLILIITVGVFFWLFKRPNNVDTALPQRQSHIKTRKQSYSTSQIMEVSPQVSSTESEDGLADFTINFGASDDSESSNQTSGRWISENESLVIQGRALNRGFYYYGGKLIMLIGFGTEPSMIDDTLPTKAPSNNNSTSYRDTSLGYWPSYSSLSPACRGVYLDWLASERSDPNTPIGYIFIYFAGLERRIIEDRKTKKVSDSEFIAIFKEVARLNKVYSTQSSFNYYSLNFLEYMTLVRPHLFYEDPDLKSLIPPYSKQSELRFKYELANTVASGYAIPAPLAWHWLILSGEYNFKTPAKRCENEFRKLFKLRYEQAYPNGFTISPNDTKLKLTYHTSSRSIHRTWIDLGDLPDPSVLKAPIKKLISIADQCNAELESYSRYLGKENTSKDDVAAILLLPKTLIQEIKPQVIEDFRKWANNIIETKQGLTSTRSLWAHLKEPLPNSLTKKHNEILLNLAELSGFGLVPNMRHHQTRIKSDGNVVLFKNEQGNDFIVSSVFSQTALALRLGAMVATIDGYVDNHEVTVLRELINKNKDFSEIEKHSLEAYLTWHLNTPSNMSGLKAKLENLDEVHTTSISRFIISIALANGSVEPSQIKQIEKLYNALGLDKSRVANDIHHLTTSLKKSSRIENMSSDSGSIDSNLNDQPTTKSNFNFDSQALALYENETEDAKAMLANIFSNDDEGNFDNSFDSNEDELEATAENPNKDHTKSSLSATIMHSGLEGLDQPHSQLYFQLITQEAWTFEEVEALCAPLNLMIHGAIETINDWAFDRVDAPVIDEDDEILIDFEIVEELSTLNK